MALSHYHIPQHVFDPLPGRNIQMITRGFTTCYKHWSLSDFLKHLMRLEFMDR